MRLYYADRDHYDAWTDAVSTGDFDDGLLPARLPGRLNIFQTSRRPSRRDPASLPGRSSGANSTEAEQAPTPLPVPARPVDPSTSDGVPWSRDAA